MFIVYILSGLLGLFALVMFLGGFIAYRMALIRKDKHVSLHEPDPKAELRTQGTEAGKEYLFGLNPEDITMQSRDGLTLKGYFIPSPRPSNKLAVLSHGYTCTGPDEFAGFLKFYREELNFNVLLPDHRSHGRSGGKYIGFAALEWQDLLDWTETYVKRLGTDPQVILHGVSMGAATVMNFNAHNPPDYVKCVVEDCGYTNGYEMVWLSARRDLKLNIPPLMWGLAFWYRLCTGKSLKKDSDPYGNIASFKAPTLFIHGATDDFVPTEMGIRCHEAASIEKDLLLIDGAAHAMSYFIDKAAYEAKLREWFARWVKENVTA